MRIYPVESISNFWITGDRIILYEKRGISRGFQEHFKRISWQWRQPNEISIKTSKMMSKFSGKFKRHAQCEQLKVSQLASSSSLILTFSLLFFTGTISHFNIWSQWRNINDLKSSCGSTEFGDLIDWRLLQTGARGEVATIRPDNYSCKCSTLLAVIPLIVSLYSG